LLVKQEQAEKDQKFYHWPWPVI